MARIDRLEQKEPGRTSVHAAVDATYQVFELDGAIYLQIDTYGSSDRQFRGKVSQSVQFGPEGIAALREILSSLR
ncbi:MAG: hypothetical protein Kow0013_12030 [Pararhodobacter sp.]